VCAWCGAPRQLLRVACPGVHASGLPLVLLAHAARALARAGLLEERCVFSPGSAAKVPLPLPFRGLELRICPRAALGAGSCRGERRLRVIRAGFSHAGGPAAPGSLSSISLPSSVIPVQTQYPAESTLELQDPAFIFDPNVSCFSFFKKNPNTQTTGKMEWEAA